MEGVSPSELWQIVALRLSERMTWWQLAALAFGVLVAVGFSALIHRKQSAAPVGVYSSPLITGPLILWLWLLIAASWMRRNWGLDTDLLHYAILLVGALTVIRIGVFILRHNFNPGSKLLVRWEGALTLTIWGIVALHILGWLPAVTDALDEHAVVWGKARISALTVTSFLLSSGVLVLIALGLANAIRQRLQRSEALTASMKLAVAKLSKFLLLTVAVLVAVTWAGIDLTALTVFGGALGVGIGLGLQRVVSNFVSGFVVAFEESVRPGDIVSIGNVFGTVQTLDARFVVVRNGDGMDILIPNEELITSQVTNWSYQDSNVRLHLPVHIAYKDDPEHAMRLMRDIAAAHPRVLSTPPAQTFLLSFADHGILLELAVWIGDPHIGLANVRSELYLAIWRAFQSAGITIPANPQTTSPAVAAISPPHGI